MSRSVVNWVIAAAVLCAGATVTGPDACADPIGDTGAGATDAGSVVAGNPDGGNDGPRRRRGPVGAQQSGGTEPWPCPWRPIPIPPVYPNNSLIGIDVAVPVVVPVPQVTVPAPRAAVLDAGILNVAIPQVVAVAQPAATAAGTASAEPMRAAPPPPRRQSGPASPPRPPAASLPPAAAIPLIPAPPLQRQDPSAGVRLGYPEELRTADLSRILSTALPGLAAIAGMTALGGMLGYRQAKAGYMLRAAGASRFLQ